MIAFVQPFPLDGHGGGARILRSLLEAAPAPYLSVCTAPVVRGRLRSQTEVHLPRRPAFGRFEATRLHRQFARLDPVCGTAFKRRLAEMCAARDVTAIHAIPHGIEFWYAFEVAQRLRLRYVLNVHDDLPYNLDGIPYLPTAMERLGQAWRDADVRIVISKAMGEEYVRRYGHRPYTVVTDGLRTVSAEPRSPTGRRVYFMGSVHLSYEANFRTLLEALQRVRSVDPDVPASLTMRGGASFPLSSGEVPVCVRSWGTQADVQADCEEADFLYLPLPFGAEYEAFTRFSLSTKLVTYLGSGVPILYHGPENAAASRLLEEHGAAVAATESGIESLVAALATDVEEAARASANALVLARSQFRLRDQQRAFWRCVAPQSARPSVTGALAC